MQAPTLLDLPPGPEQPRTAQALQWITRPREFLLRQRERFGDVFTIDFIDGEPLVVLADPADVRTVFTGGAALMHAGEANRLLEPIVGSRSILLLDEGEHLRQRRLLLPAFHGERLRDHVAIMREATAREVDTWRAGERLAVLGRMQAITLEVIMRAVFGVEEGLELERLRDLVRRMLTLTTDWSQLLLTFLAGPGSPRVVARRRAALAPLDEELGRIVAERRAAPDVAVRGDVLSLLLCARDDDGMPLGDGELRDELVTLLLAGHETTASTLAWCLERLTRHPQALARVTAEARSGADELPYADAAIQETLRLRSVLPIVVRRITAPLVVGRGRFHLPAGTRIAPSILLVHLRPDLYPEPLEFRPERFLDGAPRTYTWIPFGGGLRRCVGAAFAQLEMREVLRETLARVELEPLGGDERITRRALTLVPRRGARVRVVRRVEPAEPSRRGRRSGRYRPPGWPPSSQSPSAPIRARRGSSRSASPTGSRRSS